MTSKKKLRKKIKRLKKYITKLEKANQAWKRAHDSLFEERRQIEHRLAQYEYRGLSPDIRLGYSPALAGFPCTTVAEYNQDEPAKDSDVWWQETDTSE